MKSLFVLLFLISIVNAGILKTRKNRIIGSHEAQEHEAPYIVSLQYFREHLCSGALIQRNLVLTAAHCIVFPVSVTTVVAGIHDINEGSYEQINYARTSIIHSDYDGTRGVNDIAIVALLKYFVLTPEIQLIAMPQDNFIHSGMATIYGWGSITPPAAMLPTKLRTLDLPIIGNKVCEKVLGGPGAAQLNTNNICTGPLEGEFAPCSGDSGAPLVQKNSNGLVELVGIFSWGYLPCGAKNSPTIYTRVSAYLEWIENNSIA